MLLPTWELRDDLHRVHKTLAGRRHETTAATQRHTHEGIAIIKLSQELRLIQSCREAKMYVRRATRVALSKQPFVTSIGPMGAARGGS